MRSVQGSSLFRRPSPKTSFHHLVPKPATLACRLNLWTKTNTMSDTIDNELSLLESLYTVQGGALGATSQREIAREAGLSLGMTNALLKRFVERGWVSVRHINARNLHYALTPEGVNEVARRTYRFFKRSARNASFYKERLEELVLRKKREGFTRIVLAGASDLDFIFDYLCERHGLLFVKGADPNAAARLGTEGTLIVWAEGSEEPCASVSGVSLNRIMAGVGE